MSLAGDQHAIQYLSAQRADEALAVRVGRRRRLRRMKMIGTVVSG
jgi:hypothetical protein